VRLRARASCCARADCAVVDRDTRSRWGTLYIYSCVNPRSAPPKSDILRNVVDFVCPVLLNFAEAGIERVARSLDKTLITSATRSAYEGRRARRASTRKTRGERQGRVGDRALGHGLARRVGVAARKGAYSKRTLRARADVMHAQNCSVELSRGCGWAASGEGVLQLRAHTYSIPTRYSTSLIQTNLAILNT
jgi:hypothetical protein